MATTADVALLPLRPREGVFEQLQQHIRMAGHAAEA